MFHYILQDISYHETEYEPWLRMAVARGIAELEQYLRLRLEFQEWLRSHGKEE